MKKIRSLIVLFALFFGVIGFSLISSGNPSPLKSKGNTLFSTPMVIPLPVSSIGQASAVKIADFNNDGFNDVLIVTSSSNLAGCQLLVYCQNPSVPGTFYYPAIYDYPSQGSGASSVDVGDLNNNGFPEVVLAFGDYVCVFDNDHGSLIAGELFAAGSELSTIKIGEVTNDSLSDIVVSTKNDDCLGILINQGDLQFVGVGLPALHSSADNQLAVVDQNNDGKNDIILLRGNSPLNTIAIYYQNSQGVFNLPSYLDLGEKASVLAVGSLDSVLGIDIAAFSELSLDLGKLSLWSSANIFDPPTATNIPPQTAAMTAADFDQDGTDEIIAAHQGSNIISILWCNSEFIIGASMFCYTNFSALDPHNALTSGDLNHDGSFDLAIADSSLGLVILFNDNLTSLNELSKKQSFTVYPNPFKEQLTVKFKTADAYNLINIYNALGQKVASQQTEKNQVIFSTVSFAPGFYTIEVILPNGQREVIKALKIN